MGTTSDSSGALSVARPDKSNDLLLDNLHQDDFVRLIGHELRSPLTSILGYARLLKSRPDLGAEMIQEAVTDIDREGVRLQRMIENFLLLARSVSTVKPSEPMLLSRQVHIIVNEFQQHSDRQIEIDELDMEDTIVLADASSLTHVVENLLANVVMHAPSKEAALVRLTSAGGEAIISVLDRGPGIPAEERQAIFQTFSSLDTAHDRRHGIGLGLVVCHHLLDAQGGRIWFSEREGGGADFSFTLPLAD